MSAGASAIQALFTAGWLGIGGHQRFLQSVTYAPPHIKGFSKKPQKRGLNLSFLHEEHQERCSPQEGVEVQVGNRQDQATVAILCRQDR